MKQNQEAHALKIEVGKLHHILKKSCEKLQIREESASVIDLHWC